MNIDEQAVIGSTYTRCCDIHICNNLGVPPHIDFAQEKVLKTDTGIQVLSGAPGILTVFDPTASFPILNPNTGETVNTVTHAELYAILYSAWLHYRKG